MKNIAKYGAVSALSLVIGASAAFAENIKIAFIDPLSGPFASTGTNGLHQFEFAADYMVNDKGGLLDGQKMEVLPFDNKVSPKESLIQLQVAIDQGARYVVQGNSSGVANALTEAIDKHNRRNPDSRVLFLNYAAVDPALTNDKCNFWHFRFDANSDIKMDALTDVIVQDKDIKKVYIIGQDYSFGKAVSAAANEMLGAKGDGIEVVGDELHPIGKVKDFTPYARKVVSSGADAVITGNWGADMLGIGKAIIDNGFEGPIYTYYAAGSGITAAFGESGKDKIRLISQGSINPIATEEARDTYNAFLEKYPDGNIDQSRIFNTIGMLAQAITEAGSATDVVAVASKLEGMEYDSMWGGKLFMRPQDHQIIQDMHVGVHTNDNLDFDYDQSGYGVVTESTVEMASMDSPTTCEMKRPE
ncbi:MULTISPECIES: branched-chain amino acid ABC transporter substrate-binding protein [Sulfitobacter]|jgi:branched-chain amino acid transport system substrate-binding protein|uniref:branched-chain amino acid ABC transporter substrate-binding protein n=1 Tax=Sulfitobacter TaxID=60136 RepID=UPI0004532B14|nr:MULTISPECIES: branched-chain amino acid ABC transporter substrate-binding protein [Sulfitobacter]KAJ29485.1 branched-chain amino acid ABC transporter substrate-binding protein [Sulfitobacter pontiacus 3SOLIMAR09]ULO21940.1 branched-chain amino acid ABC transporter substrate-binding protein [Sulfitobacter sp. CB2047]GLO79851.1 branched-chain amino acid ABC transporter substrate-binding protein [Sulfitobacter pontiacus]HBM39733.1 branched-chain amino acid ABC transporter substrate-binding prot|tara:strand:- start:1181 stop:2428 length:1248 start_codon:yes stop_codon:yes gene_type:complete